MNRFRAFVGHHDLLFTTLGALLVACAFYSQDLNLDPLHKDIDGIDAAIAEKADVEYINDKIEDMRRELRDNLIPGHEEIFKDINDKYKASSFEFDAADDDLRIVRTVLGRLPTRPPDLTMRGAALSDQFHALRPQEAKLLSDLEVADLPGVKGATDIDLVPGYKKLAADGPPFVIASAAFVSSVVNFQKAVGDEAGRQRADLAARADRWQAVSYLLIVLGGISSFAGKLLKLPELGGDAG
jgi:hypothetical protein